MENSEHFWVRSMDDGALKYYYRRHLRSLADLEERLRMYQALVQEEIKEADKRGLTL